MQCLKCAHVHVHAESILYTYMYIYIPCSKVSIVALIFISETAGDWMLRRYIISTEAVMFRRLLTTFLVRS